MVVPIRKVTNTEGRDQAKQNQEVPAHSSIKGEQSSKIPEPIHWADSLEKGMRRGEVAR